MNCPVKQYCTHKYCIHPANRWINDSNCTCKGCIGRSKKKICPVSGDPYNTDGDCLMEK